MHWSSSGFKLFFLNDLFYNFFTKLQIISPPYLIFNYYLNFSKFYEMWNLPSPVGAKPQ